MTTDERLDRIEKLIESNHQELKTYVLDFRTETINRFEGIDQRLDTLAGAMNSIDARMPVLTRAITGLESRVYQPRDKFAELEERVRKLEGAA